MELKVDPRAAALIFDIDGTLADTMPLHFLAWQETYRNYGQEFTKELFLEYAGIPTTLIAEDLNRRFGLAVPVAEFSAAKDDFYRTKLHQVKEIEPVARLARDTFGKLPMALGTGEIREIALLNIRAIGMEPFFNVMVTVDDVKHPKPDPETFLKCAALLNVDPERCQVFEDAERGLEAARQAGMIVTDIRRYVKSSF